MADEVVLTEQQQAKAAWDEEAAARQTSKDADAGVPAPKVEVVAPPAAEEKKDPPAKAEEKKDPPAPPDPIAALEGRVRKIESNVGNVITGQKEIKDLLTASAAAAAKAVNDAPSQAQIAKAVKDPELWTKLKGDFPEWADATEAYVDARLTGFKPQVVLDDAAIDKRISDATAAVRGEVKKEMVHDILDGVFPDWKADINSDPFAKWFEAQPEEVKKLAASEHVRDAAQMLKLYHGRPQTQVATIKAARTEKLTAAAAAPGKSAVASASKTVEEMTAEELWNYEAQQRDRQRASRGY